MIHSSSKLIYQISPSLLRDSSKQPSYDLGEPPIHVQHHLMSYFLDQGFSGGTSFYLRYFFDPQDASDNFINIYLVCNFLTKKSSEYFEYRNALNSLLNVFDFHTYYTCNEVTNGNFFWNLDWVTCVGELLKSEKIFKHNQLLEYVAYPFRANSANDMMGVCEALNRLNERFILEVTLQPIHPTEQPETLAKALKQMQAHLKGLSSQQHREPLIDEVLKTYQYYQTTYLTQPVFQYSIKALAENPHSVRPILQRFLQSATTASSLHQAGNIIVINREQDEQRFLASLRATENIEISTDIEWEGWQGNLGEQFIRKNIQLTPKSPGLGDNSTSHSLHQLPGSNYPSNPFSSPLLSAGSPTSDSPSSSSLVPGSSSALSRYTSQHSHATALSRIKDLKPLHRLASLEEISGFFRIVIPGNRPVPGMAIVEHKPPTATAEELFEQYAHLITEDTYIVGLDDNGKLVTSSWAEIPHRLVAGVPGSGKSSFLKWVIFQFLYASSENVVYITDFGGVDFQHLPKLSDRVHLITDIDSCSDFVERIHSDEYERRLTLMQEYGVAGLPALKEEGCVIGRALWVIDEAADIADASSKLRTNIENRLKAYARKGRKYGLQVMYCTQRPTTEVITKQVTDQCEERVVLRVSADASDRILGNRSASTISKQSRGRAVLDGYAGQLFVNIPYMKQPQGKKISVDETLWRLLHI